RDRRGGVDAAVRYLRGNAAFLRYDEALASGWPIATGVIEGACVPSMATGCHAGCPRSRPHL
ncbi:hypothetical protein, partial [Streptosporangium album]